MADENREPSWTVCAVCGYALVHDPVQTPEWFHIGADHLAVPVDSSDIIFNTRCDFCYVEHVENVVLARDFTMPMPGQIRPQRSVGGWSACDHCADLVNRGRWNDLVTHVKRITRDRGLRTPRAILVNLYAALKANLTGEIITRKEWLKRNNNRMPGPEKK